ncbi:MAG: M48 family metalloprotease [Bryobacteraceae bacterium]
MRLPLLLLLPPASALAELTYELPASQYREAIAYNRALDFAYFFGLAATLVILLAMLRWQAGARLRDFAERIVTWRLGQAFVVTAAVVVALRLLLLPLSIDRHRLAVAYRQSVQSWPSWLADWGKQAALEAFLLSISAWILLALVRRSPRRLWLYAWLLSLPVGVFATFLSPIVVEPMFYSFQPLEKTRPDLVAALETVAARAGYAVPPDRVFEMLAAEKVKSVNAYMTGFGPTRRIVVWDTTIAALTAPQIESVFAHELGHYALHHIPRSIALGSLLLLLCLFAGGRLARSLIARYGSRLRIRGLDDWAVVPLALALVVFFGFFSDPLVNGYSRWQERQADIYELNVMRTLVPDAGRLSAEVDQIMGQIDLSNPAPSPFIVFWLYTHPSTPDRMHFAQRYVPGVK